MLRARFDFSWYFLYYIVMRIKSIELNNFRSYKHGVFCPAETGVSALCGASGAGKSTFLTGLVWCLFGVTPGGVRNIDLARRGMDEGEKVSVVVVADTVHGEMKVVRSMNPSGSVKVQVWVDGKPRAAASTKSAMQVISELTGLNATLALGAFCIQQGQLEALSDSSPAKRKKTVEDIAGFTTISKAVDNAHEVVKDVRGLLKSVDASLEDKSSVLDAVRGLRSENKVLEGVASPRLDIIEQWGRAGGVLERVKAQWVAYENDKKVFDSWVAATGGMDRDSIVSSVDDLKNNLDSIVKADEEAMSVWIEARREYDRNRQKVEELNKTVAKGDGVCRVDVDSLRDELDSVSGLVSDMRVDYGELKASYDIDVRDREDFSSLAGTCPTCRQKVSDDFVSSNIKRLDEQIAEKSCRLEKIVDDGKNLAVKQSDLEKKIKEGEFNNSVLDDAENAKKMLESLEIVECPDKPEGHGGEIEALREEISKLTQKLAVLDNKPSIPVKPDVTIAEAEKDEKELKVKVEKEKLAEKEYAKAQQQLSENRHKLLSLEKQLETIEKAEKLVDELNEALKTEKLLDDFRLEHKEKLLPTIEEKMNNLIGTVTGGEYVNVEVGEDYDIALTDQWGNRKTYSELSGGEKAIGALALRLALTPSDSSLIWADEIGANLDDERREKLMNALSTIGETSQLIVISHNGGDVGVFDNVFRVSKDSEGLSVIN